ncbi:hypothetical protein SA3733_08100 [Aggregatibacter actinomycetemcomitans serotype d str. SA3733]|nr:hypothetical protein SA508_06970 [Aggregatibacter actinomycetemcomitans serotype d str. SA508]KYK92876.1 hypothetical protein SA3733_08100 [Aggregatibacter actinomycetemcomitans serotype d str. SA3733]KYK94537.1 hypothetical protein SA269_00050 [Aggregatibacter actinomycetemcomitans serotype d str. SA269]
MRGFIMFNLLLKIITISGKADKMTKVNCG